MLKDGIKICAAVIASLLLMSSPASAAKPVSSSPQSKPLGMDISYPQCSTNVPTNQSFGVVGVNGGVATTTNPCLSKQLLWATISIGGTPQDRAQVYVNTANPGGLNTESWPSNNTDPAGNTPSNPYGTCNHSDSYACAWQYGWNRAVQDVQERFVPGATQAGVASDPGKYVWWLDVETSNTWKLSGTSFDYTSNRDDLEGMTAYFRSLGARVGIYSTAAQWGKIVGKTVDADSNLAGLLNWRPGGASLSTAQAACTAAPLTVGGQVVMTQFISKSLDYDYSCI